MSIFGAGGSQREKEQRSHHKYMVALAVIASLINALAAGFGLAAGLTDVTDGLLGGVAVPIVLGVAIAICVGIAWHILLPAAPRVVTAKGTSGTVLAAFIVAAATICASSWGLATAMCGGSAQEAYMSDVLDTDSHALDAAWAGARSEGGMIDAAKGAAGDMRNLAVFEEKGGITGKRGNGLATTLVSAGASSYSELADRMQAALGEAGKEYAKGRQILQQMHKAISSDPDKFAELAINLQGIVSDLNAFHLTGMASRGGITQVSTSLDQMQTDRLRDSATAINQKVLARAQEIQEARPDVSVPDYHPISKRWATLKYGMTVAIGGWICAIGLDIFPLVFFLIVRSTRDEEQLLRPMEPAQAPTHLDYDRTYGPDYDQRPAVSAVARPVAVPATKNQS